jgi:hypothetical protein
VWCNLAWSYSLIHLIQSYFLDIIEPRHLLITILKLQQHCAYLLLSTDSKVDIPTRCSKPDVGQWLKDKNTGGTHQRNQNQSSLQGCTCHQLAGLSVQSVRRVILEPIIFPSMHLPSTCRPINPVSQRGHTRTNLFPNLYLPSTCRSIGPFGKRGRTRTNHLFKSVLAINIQVDQ